MKFKTFRGLLIGGALIGGIGIAGGSCMWCIKAEKNAPAPSYVPPTAKTVPVATITGAVASATAAPDAPAHGAAQPVRAMDRDVLARIAGPVPGDRIKEAFPGRAYKVSIYKDAGHAKANRVKIDLDRNGKWDEKWTIEDDGTIKRQVAPRDDEDYTIEYRLRGETWEPKDKS
ncbi:MAG: hypothetical protein KC657_19925 [Myxococcales bacterium]|nr:hypothetical protein [Myxococcales bacterium]